MIFNEIHRLKWRKATQLNVGQLIISTWNDDVQVRATTPQSKVGRHFKLKYFHSFECWSIDFLGGKCEVNDGRMWLNWEICKCVAAWENVCAAASPQTATVELKTRLYVTEPVSIGRDLTNRRQFHFFE